jgi:glycine/D-amino acid oxidase-like deaminating enzyme
MPSRRELLRGIAGLPFVACRRKTAPAIAGAIVGGAHQRGHRLRDGFRATPARTEELSVAILGAGIAGLSAAWTLERAGFSDYVVLELEDAPGGTARSGESTLSAFPWGAHYVPVPPDTNRPLVALLEEVGAVAGRDAAGHPRYAEEMLCREPQERLFFMGEWYEGLYPHIGASAEDLRQLDAFEARMRAFAAFRDDRGRRGFTTPRARSSDAAELRALDGRSMADWLEEAGFRSPRLRWLVEYGCRDDFGATLAQTSAWAGVHYFASRLERPESEPAEFLTWPEGNGRLVAHLARLVGARLRLGAMVASVNPTRDSVEVVYQDDARHEAVTLRARQAIFALPRFLAARLVLPWRDAPPAWLAETRYGSWMVANLTLRDRPASRGFPFAWDNVIYDSAALGYVVATHQTTRDIGPTVWTYYMPMLDNDPRRGRSRLLETRHEDWVEIILKDLSRAHRGLRELVERIDVYLWGHAMVRPRPGFLWSEALRAGARPLGRLHFAHTDLSGIALFEEAQHWGIRAAEAVLAERGHAFRSWL